MSVPQSSWDEPLLRIAAAAHVQRAVAPVVGLPMSDEPPDLVLRLVGELDVSNVDTAADELAELIGRRPRCDVVLDLSGLTFMDVAGLRVLLEVRRTLTQGGRAWSVRGASPGVALVVRASRQQDLLEGSSSLS